MTQAEQSPELASGETQQHLRFSRRLQWFTLASGFAASAIVLARRSGRDALGIAIGTLLAWLNYRWMEGGIEALISAAKAQAGIPQPRIPASVYGKFAGRYILIGLLVYATVFFLHIPLVMIILGLLALGAGAMAEGLYEIILGDK